MSCQKSIYSLIFSQILFLPSMVKGVLFEFTQRGHVHKNFSITFVFMSYVLGYNAVRGLLKVLYKCKFLLKYRGIYQVFVLHVPKLLLIQYNQNRDQGKTGQKGKSFRRKVKQLFTWPIDRLYTIHILLQVCPDKSCIVRKVAV